MIQLSRQYEGEELKELENISNMLHEILFSNSKEEGLVDILSKTTNEERQLIRNYYKKTYNHPIQNDLISKLTGKLKEITINMFDTPYEYDARELHTALNSFANDDITIVEIFSSRPKAHLEIVDVAYKNFFKISLREDIKKQGSKEYSQFLLALMDLERPVDQSISGEEAYEIADELIKNGLKVYGTDINLFKNVFIEKSREDLIIISRAYYEKTKQTLYDAIEEEVEGKNKRLLKGLLFAIITPAQWFAKKCYKVIRGTGGDYKTLSRILISRSEIDMYAIRDYYFMETNHNINDDIADDNDISGTFGQILVNLSVS